MPTIKALYSREVLDARGVPTIECALWLDNGGYVVTSVPSGTSKGKYEAVELRDNDHTRMAGLGVLKAVNQLNTIIAPQLIGKDPTDQAGIDQLLVSMDGTKDKSKLGSNALIAVSQAVLMAGALSTGLPLYSYIQQKYQLTANVQIPACIYSVINGGDHGADNLDIQEFQLIPASHMPFKDSLNLAVSIFQKLETVLVSKGATHSFGVLGGFTPNLYNNTDVFHILTETIKTSPYTLAQDVFFGIDAAASTFYKGGKYTLRDKSQPYAAQDLVEYYLGLRNSYHVIYLEDPFEEDDNKSWQQLTEKLAETTTIAGDSLLVTNREKTQQAIQDKLCNTIVIKPNQVGTISESIDVIQLARSAGWQVVVSHRSGETCDTFIADFGVGIGADYVKFGPPSRGERTAKYNRLLQIEQDLQRQPT